MIAIKNKAGAKICLVSFFLNFILFAIKLYVGLSSNIISIYSDGVNNLFDSLSGLVTAMCFLWAAKSESALQKGFLSKTEQLLSLGLSVIVVFSGLVFAYSSAERLMYPTPMWFTMSFLWMLTGTAACKLVMYFFFKRQNKKANSQVLSMMCLDCRLDFFINLVTIITLIVSKLEFYSFDALCGIGISVMIIISGGKSLISAAKDLINLPDNDIRQELESMLSSFGFDGQNCEVTFQFADVKEAFVKSEKDIDCATLEQMKSQAFEKTGIELYLLK